MPNCYSTFEQISEVIDEDDTYWEPADSLPINELYKHLAESCGRHGGCSEAAAAWSLRGREGQVPPGGSHQWTIQTP